MSDALGRDGSEVRRVADGLVEYDSRRRRVWVCGQRLHHGLTGALLVAGGVAAFATNRISPRGSLEWTLLGSVLMAHDWDDRHRWFKPGAQD